MGAIEAQIAEDQHWVAGEKRTININVKQADGTTAQTMTGWALKWVLKDHRTGAVRFTKTTVSGITIGDGSGTNDQARVAIAAADTLALPAAVYFHELTRTDVGSEAVLSFGDAHLHAMGLP